MGAVHDNLAAGEPSERPWPLPTAQKTLDELRDLILELSRTGPAQHSQPTCPFRILSGLTYTSLTHLVGGMSRETCLNLFEPEWPCICQAYVLAAPPVGISAPPAAEPRPAKSLT